MKAAIGPKCELSWQIKRTHSSVLLIGFQPFSSLKPMPMFYPCSMEGIGHQVFMAGLISVAQKTLKQWLQVKTGEVTKCQKALLCNKQQFPCLLMHKLIALVANGVN